MLESHALVEALADALRADGVDAPDLAPTAPPIVTGRSTLQRLVDRSTGEQYLVKQPIVVGGWVDTEDVLTAADQYAALELAHLWQHGEDRHAVVRPVAFLAEQQALAMAWAPGRTVLQVIHRAPVDPRAARLALRAAGDFLRRFHRHGRRPDDRTTLAAPAAEVLELAAGPLQAAGLRVPVEVTAAVALVSDRAETHARALLHGDYEPSNLIVRRPGEVVMLDPLLSTEGPAVDDVARFLTVLSSDSVFLAGVVLPPLRRLRRRLESDFRTAYGIGDSELLELRLLKQHLLRWLRRRENTRLRGVPVLRDARALLIDAHMRALLLESAARLTKAAGQRAGGRSSPQPS